MDLKKRLGAFQEGTSFKVFLLSVLITGLSYGLYKGMLDNFLVEIVGMGEMDRGIAEFFRDHVQAPAAIFAIENAPHSMQAYCPEETAQAVQKMMEM